MLFVLDLWIALRLLYSSLSSIPFHHLAWISCCYLFSFTHFSPLSFFVPATSSFKKWTEVLLKLVLGSLLQVLDTYEPRKTTVDAYIQDSTSTRLRLDFVQKLAGIWPDFIDLGQDCECLKDKKVGEQALKFIHQAVKLHSVSQALWVFRSFDPSEFRSTQLLASSQTGLLPRSSTVVVDTKSSWKCSQQPWQKRNRVCNQTMRIAADIYMTLDSCHAQVTSFMYKCPATALRAEQSNPADSLVCSNLLRETVCGKMHATSSDQLFCFKSFARVCSLRGQSKHSGR